MNTTDKSAATKPDFFFSYSTAEQTNSLLSMLLWSIFHNDYNIRITPSALTSGASQLSKIEKEISESAFGVVCLDGLRPNVIHEWGFMRGHNNPVILLKREGATVDVRHFIGESAPKLENPILDMNVHLSNLKDINYAKWFPDDPPKSAKIIWDEYEKLRTDHADRHLLQVKELQLW
jgi:hypothetical protein